MIDKIEETIHGNKGETLFIKTTGLSNPKNFVLTHNCFNTYMVFFFSDLKKTQIYKVPNREGPRHKIRILMSFVHLKFLKPNEDTEEYHIKKPNDKSFLFEIENKKVFM